MKTYQIQKAIALILLLSSSIILFAQPGKPLFVPQIKYDNATFSGKITGMISTDSVFKPINLSFNNVVTADRMSYDVLVKKDGTFFLSIPVQCISFAVVQSDYYENMVCLIPGEETRLEISYDSDQKKHVKLINSLGLSADDAVNMMEVVNSALDDTTTTSKKVAPEMTTPEIYSQRIISRLTKCLKLIENTDKLSGAAKQIAKSETKAWFISSFMFDFDKWLRLDYINYYKTSSVPNDFQPQKPGRSYYSFLKSLNLEDPANFSASFYSNVLQLILSNDTMAIPAIGDTPVES